jgi:hypothetical protein
MVFDIQGIRSKTYVLTLEQFLMRIRSGRLRRRLNHNKRLNTEKRIEYIEEIIMGLPQQPIYVTAINQMASWKVIDGMQRIKSLEAFFKPDGFTIDKTKYLHSIVGNNFSDLSFAMQRRLLDTEIIVYALIGEYTPEEEKELYKIIDDK